jgi:hypothetical protein
LKPCQDEKVLHEKVLALRTDADEEGPLEGVATCQYGDEFSDLAHRFFLLMEFSQMTLVIADALQEKRKLAKRADSVGGANILGRECFISTAIKASG